MKLRAGIDLGGTKIQAAVLDHHDRVVGSARRPTPTEGGPPAISEAMAEALREAAGGAEIRTKDLSGIGVGAPGAVDSKAGSLARAGNLSEWRDPFPLGPVLESALEARVRLGNDVDVATLAELELGAGRPFSSLIGVFWGTGVGGGVVLNRKIWRGRGAAGEIGHMKVEQHDGLPCGCGRRGCMEAYAGRGSMERRAREAVAEGRQTRLFEIMEERGRTRLASGVWELALSEGDALAEELIADALHAMGVAVASAVNLLDVEAVIVGGGLGTRLGQPYADRLALEMAPVIFYSERPPAVLVAELGDLGGAIGAALLVD